MANLDCSIVFQPHPTGKFTKRFIDLTGHVNGRLTVIGYAGRRGHASYWYCKCECGNVKAINSCSLKTDTSRSCGCLKKELTSKRQSMDLTGRVYGRLKVLSFAGRRNNASLWNCECECGVVRSYHLGALRSGHTFSCGCFNIEQTSNANRTHGNSIGRRITPEFQTYRSMLQRCTNKNHINFHRYGGRGIKCLFGSLEEFIECVGVKPSRTHSIDRIDNNGHYEPGNVRWATTKEQANNKRTTIRVTIDGVTKGISEWLICNSKEYKRAKYMIRRGVEADIAVMRCMAK